MRTRPALALSTSPASSRTRRCFRNDGPAIANGAASSDTDAGPRTSRSTTRSRVGSASAPNTAGNRALTWAMPRV